MAGTGHLSTETLADHAEGLLREAEAAAVEAHVAECPECSAEQALLLALPGLLAADDVGPMPAAYAARIDAALAAAAATPPPIQLTPAAAAGPASAATPVADVVDLAARRQGRSAPRAAGRVTSVAASLVLLLGGTVLGLQALNSDGGDAPTPNDVAVEAPEARAPGAPDADEGRAPAPPVQTPKAQSPKAPKAQPPKAQTAKSTARNPAGAGTENGTVSASSAASSKASPDSVRTGVKRTAPAGAETKTESTRMTEATDAKAPETAAVESTQAPAEQAPAGDSTQRSTAPATKQQPPVQTFGAPGARTAEPYVEDSRSTYTQENFEAKVRALVGRAGAEPAAGEATPQPAPDPLTRLLLGPAADYRAEIAGVPGEPPQAGPAVRDKVKRCAGQLGGRAVAGDTGIWRGQAVTVVVLADPDDTNRVIGHVVTGPCTDERRARDNLRFKQAVALKP